MSAYRWVRREPLRIFIGFDSREPVAWHVCASSILRRASVPVMIAPLVQRSLRSVGLYTRARGATEATEFSMTRFLVPYLCGFYGHAVFMDCDMIMRVDVAELWDHIIMQDKALLVCQHEYEPKEGMKMDGQVQTRYPRKNWSSFMVFDNTLCRALTPAYVNTATGLQLHRFQWLKDSQIGSLPLEWNWLVGEYKRNQDAKVLHWTLGGPWMSGYEKTEYAEDWRIERAHMDGQHLLGAVGYPEGPDGAPGPAGDGLVRS